MLRSRRSSEALLLLLLLTGLLTGAVWPLLSCAWSLQAALSQLVSAAGCVALDLPRIFIYTLPAKFTTCFRSDWSVPSLTGQLCWHSPELSSEPSSELCALQVSIQLRHRAAPPRGALQSEQNTVLAALARNEQPCASGPERGRALCDD